MASGFNRLLGTTPPRPAARGFSRLLGPSPSRTPETPERAWAGGPLADVFDALSLGQYAAAGIVTGKGIKRGVEERTSYGELFTPAFRQTIPGRVSEFALNVLGDPTTYIPVGGLAARGLRALPGGAKAIELARAPVKALATRTGFAFPTEIRAARAVEGLTETRLEPLRETLRGVRSEQTLARAEAAVFSREFRRDALQTAGGNRQGAVQLHALASRYFDVPADHIVHNIRAFEGAVKTTLQEARKGGKVSDVLRQHLTEAKQVEFIQVRQQALQLRDSWLQTLDEPTRGFVVRWGERVAKQHDGDLARLVGLKLLRPDRAELWRHVYLRNSFLRHIDPERYADLLAKEDPRRAAEILAQVERRPGTAGGIPGRAQIKPRKPEHAAAFAPIQALDERYALQRGLNAELIARGELNGQVARLYGVPEEAVDRLSRSVPGFERLFRPMPDDARWGVLGGRWVPKEVHDILTATAWKPEGALATFVKLVSAWKIGKVSMPSTIRRNITSNFALIQTRFGTRGLAGVLRELPAAFDDLKNTSEMFTRAIKAHPGFGSSQLDAEVRDLLKAAGTPATGGNIADAIVNAVQKVGRPFTTAYEFSELVPKLAIFRHGVKAGLSDEAAAKAAMLTLFDYGDVPPAVSTLRRYGLWPFVTFPYKVLTHTLPEVARHPGRTAQQVKLIRALSSPTTEEERRTLPASLRSGGFVKVPLPDWKGRPIFYDLSYELFFGDLGEPGTPIGQAVAMLQGHASPGEAIPTFLTPIGQVAAEIAMNKSFFTGQPVYRPEEPSVLASGRHIARAALPGAVFSVAETAATPALRRAGLKPSSVLARAVYGTPTARGIEPQSVPSAMAQTFGGFRTVPLDIPRQQQANLAGYRARLDELKRRVRSISRDQALLPTDKTAALRRLQAQMQQLVEQFRREGVVL